MVLESIGLAESAGPKTWRVRRDFVNILRAMQRSADRQKTLAAHGALVSDDRLQMTVQDLRSLTALEGRVLVHGKEEYSGRSYLILEGTDARLHYITYTPEIEVAGACERILSFSFRKSSAESRPALEIDEMGDSEAMLRNNRKLRETGQRLIRRGIIPQDDGWGGWLGRYQKALRDAVTTLEIPSVTKPSERRKDRDLGR